MQGTRRMRNKKPRLGTRPKLTAQWRGRLARAIPLLFEEGVAAPAAGGGA
ncbi:hypothetical protein MNBD_PLANCTO03-499, partial [hydrothermal vent metagenome]